MVEAVITARTDTPTGIITTGGTTAATTIATVVMTGTDACRARKISQPFLERLAGNDGIKTSRLLKTPSAMNVSNRVRPGRRNPHRRFLPRKRRHAISWSWPHRPSEVSAILANAGCVLCRVGRAKSGNPSTGAHSAGHLILARCGNCSVRLAAPRASGQETPAGLQSATCEAILSDASRARTEARQAPFIEAPAHGHGQRRKVGNGMAQTGDTLMTRTTS